jgi:hypothetical protein
MSLEGIVSKQINASYKPNDRGLWVKTKCLNREEFVVVGWTDPEGTRPRIGALLLAYYDPDGRLTYVDAGEPVAPGRLSGIARGQARARGAAVSSLPKDPAGNGAEACCTCQPAQPAGPRREHPAASA